MRPATIHFVFAGKNGGGEETRTLVTTALETVRCAASTPPDFQRAIKNPALGRVRCIETNTLRPSRHGSPNDPLGHSGYLVFEGLLHKSRSLELQSTSVSVALQFGPCNSVLVRIEFSCGSHRHTNWREAMKDSHRIRHFGQDFIKALVAVGRLVEPATAQFDTGAVYP